MTEPRGKTELSHISRQRPGLVALALLALPGPRRAWSTRPLLGHSNSICTARRRSTTLPLLRMNTGAPKAQVVVAVARPPEVAISRPNEAGHAEPTATADHPGRAMIRTRWINHHPSTPACFIIILSIPVRTPLINIAVHVIQPPCIGPFPAHRMGAIR